MPHCLTASSCSIRRDSDGCLRIFKHLPDTDREPSSLSLTAGKCRGSQRTTTGTERATLTDTCTQSTWPPSLGCWMQACALISHAARIAPVEVTHVAALAHVLLSFDLVAQGFLCEPLFVLFQLGLVRSRDKALLVTEKVILSLPLPQQPGQMPISVICGFRHGMSLFQQKQSPLSYPVKALTWTRIMQSRLHCLVAAHGTDCFVLARQVSSAVG